jgi:hypothetical protein
MKKHIVIKDLDSQIVLKVSPPGDYIEIEFKGKKVSANKQVFIYTDFTTLIQYFKNIRLGIQSKRIDIAKWSTVENDFILSSNFTVTGNVNISATLQDLEECWSATIYLNLTLSDIDSLISELENVT